MGGLRGENERSSCVDDILVFVPEERPAFFQFGKVGLEDDYAGNHGAGNEGIVRVPTLANRSGTFRGVRSVRELRARVRMTSSRDHRRCKLRHDQNGTNLTYIFFITYTDYSA